MRHDGGMRLLGYTRVSTREQDARLQLDALTAAGVEARDVFADVTSGSRKAVDRPGMRKLLEYASPGDTVVVWRVDRLGRSLIDVLNTVNLLRGRQIDLRSVQDGIDPATSSGRLMLNMLATLADYERELITERVNAGIAAAKASGTRFVGHRSTRLWLRRNLLWSRTRGRRDTPRGRRPVWWAGPARACTATKPPPDRQRSLLAVENRDSPVGRGGPVTDPTGLCVEDETPLVTAGGRPTS